MIVKGFSEPSVYLIQEDSNFRQMDEWKDIDKKNSKYNIIEKNFKHTGRMVRVTLGHRKFFPSNCMEVDFLEEGSLSKGLTEEIKWISAAVKQDTC